jgi:single-stranded-DNA-specific exonuclease
MHGLNEFRQLVKTASEQFFAQVSGPIRVCSHLDADGLSAATAVIHALRKKGIAFQLSILPTIDRDSLVKFIAPTDKYIILCDFGSGQLSLLKEKLGDRRILILDHHEVEDSSVPTNFFHVNPRLQGIDGSMAISGAGVCCFFAEHLCGSLSSVAHMGIIGAIGDIQEHNGFTSLNSHLLTTALDNNLLRIEKTIKAYGLQSKPLARAIANADFTLPVKSVSAIERMLQSIDINPTTADKPTRYCDLTTYEKERLLTFLQQHATDDSLLTWNSYHLTSEAPGTIGRDGRELSTFLNACGRLGKPSVGIGLLLGDASCRKLSTFVSEAYKKLIMESIRWYKMNKGDETRVVVRENLLLLNAQDHVPGTVIGTLASIISNEQQISKGTYILALAHTDNDKIKVSLRVAGDDLEEGSPELSDLIKQIISRVGSGQAGGHSMAAGAVIERSAEDDFVKHALEVLEKQTVVVQ